MEPVPLHFLSPALLTIRTVEYSNCSAIDRFNTYFVILMLTIHPTVMACLQPVET